jgi:hypothetical protein
MRKSKSHNTATLKCEEKYMFKVQMFLLLQAWSGWPKRNVEWLGACMLGKKGTTKSNSSEGMQMRLYYKYKWACIFQGTPSLHFWRASNSPLKTWVRSFIFSFLLFFLPSLRSRDESTAWSAWSCCRRPLRTWPARYVTIKFHTWSYLLKLSCNWRTCVSGDVPSLLQW